MKIHRESSTKSRPQAKQLVSRRRTFLRFFKKSKKMAQNKSDHPSTICS